MTTKFMPPLADDHAGKVALVTGAARGIGRAICLALAREGARVAVNYYRSECQAQETLDEVRALGSEGLMVKADVSAPEQVKEMVRRIGRDLGPIDYLVNNAGIYHLVTHDQLTPEIWQRTLDVNLTGTYHVTWAVKDSMVERGFGRIVNITSISALQARPWCLSYSVTKAGMIALTKGLAAALAPHNIRVNAVAPGLVETHMLRQSPNEMIDKIVRETPLKRIGTPEEIARTVLFLLSEQSSFTTGQTWVADGGRAMLP
jgi:3-oxoacyl-[acyl-carrier protein] reductase